MEVELYQTYLDIWGDSHEINGYVRKGFKQEDKTKVWSVKSHFYKKDGKRVGGGHNLVIMSPKGEIAFWKERIRVITLNNPPEKLKLVKDNLQNMRDRIDYLMELQKVVD